MPRSLPALTGADREAADARIEEQRTRDLTEHFRAALEAGRMGTWRWEMDTGTTIWDSRLESLFGLEPGTFDGTFDMYVSLLHPEDRAEVLRVVDEAVQSKSSYRVEHRVVWRDGTVHWIAGVGAVTMDAHGAVTGTVGCTMDITDRIEREQEVRRLADVAVTLAAQERLQRERLEFIGSINDALSTSNTQHELMINVINTAVPRLGDWCSIHLVSDSRTVPRVEVAHVDPAMVAYARELADRFPYDPDAPGGVAAVIRTGITEFYPDITEEVLDQLDLTDEVRHVVDQLSLRSSIAVALKKRGRVVGAMQFVLSNTERRYTEDDVKLAETVANRIAASIENLRLHEQQREIAHTLQRSLFPPELPRIPGIELAARYWAAGDANEVGGDFYDVFALDDSDQWAVVIGDVCGKGAGAAALTGLARHSIRGSSWHGDTPIEVLTDLNRAVLRSDSGTFLTAAFATLRSAGDSFELTVVCGGHPLPVVVRGATASTIGQPGSLLGVMSEIKLIPVTAILRPGDVVIFYTDGVTDLRPPHDLATDEVLEIAQRAVRTAVTAEGILDEIQRSLESVLAFGDRDDDIAMLVVRVVDEVPGDDSLPI